MNVAILTEGAPANLAGYQYFPLRPSGRQITIVAWGNSRRSGGFIARPGRRLRESF
jgi:hypothetical protein